MKSSSFRYAMTMTCLSVLPMLAGAKGDGCAAASTTEAPDVTGAWAIEYEDQIGVEIRIGGAVYSSTVGLEGGAITIEHEGQPLTFDLDCSRPEIVCPGEAWPATVRIDQRNADYEHQMVVTLPMQRCLGTIRDADPSECGPGTNNPECDDVCDGEVSVDDEEAFGVIGEEGDSFRLYLGAGMATNGLNCALLATSVADARLETEGAGTAEWSATEMTEGVVTVAYAGGCLWVGDVTADPGLEGAIVGASVTFTVGFTGRRS